MVMMSAAQRRRLILAIALLPNKKEFAGNRYYYSVEIKDMVTSPSAILDTKTLWEGENPLGFTMKFENAPGSTEAKPLYLCRIEGLSSYGICIFNNSTI